MVEIWKTQEFDDFLEAVLRCKNKEELGKFFRDIGTLKELSDFSHRFQAAKMIDQKISYREISKKTGLSTATITRVAHWLHYGEGGYRQVITGDKERVINN